MMYKLKVDEARKIDVGKQIARIPANIADKLGLRTGDVMKLKGKRITYAKAWRSGKLEIGGDVIKLDALTRRNLKVNLDDTIEISSEKPFMAKIIELNPTQKSNISDQLETNIIRSLLDKIMVKGDIVSISTGFSSLLYFIVTKSEPSGPVIFNQNTKFSLTENNHIIEDKEDIPRINYENIGGLSEEIQKIREMIELPLRYPQIFDHLGIQPPKGVLLYGPPGTGKTLLARAIANETSSSFYNISGPEITSKYYGESEKKLREIFEEAKINPSIIFIDEIDSLVPKREGTSGEVERRIVAQLLALMDGVNERGNIVVIGATNRPNSIDEALRRGGRFDREIEIGIPSAEDRFEILLIHTRGMPLEKGIDLKSLANRTHGFVGADIEIMIKEAALYSLRRFLPNIILDQDISKINLKSLNGLNITMNDFEKALSEVTPSALREVFVETPNITWEDIGGLNEIKQELKEAIEWPLKYNKLFETMNANPPSGILLYGPPGTGKTMLAKAVANKAEANFISIKGPELLSKWIGESEKGVRELFRKARSATPCIIFFDEMDSIASSRSSNSSDEVVKRVVSQLLTEIDGLEKINGVIVLAATNRPDLIDPALLRPGRFDKVIFVGNPDQQSREAIIKVNLKNISIDSKIDIESLADRTEGFSGAELSSLISFAKMEVIREYIKSNNDRDLNENLSSMKLSNSHISIALDKIKPHINRSYNYKPTGISEMSDFA